jgi:hypothetical protein
VFPLNLYAHVRFCYLPVHMRPRVQRAPGLPCVPLLFGANEFANLGRMLSREREGMSRPLNVIARSPCDEAIQPLPCRPGLLRGACHRAGVRPTRWLAMTKPPTPGLMGPGSRPGRRCALMPRETEKLCQQASQSILAGEKVLTSTSGVAISTRPGITSGFLALDWKNG